jgi:serine/threonine protein phosphatase PrpC
MPKAGNTLEEFEDAFAQSGSGFPFRCAVADGATETSFSGLWARLLVDAYCRRQLSTRRWLHSLESLQSQWRQQVWQRPMPWYAEEKARAGAFAALAGVTIRRSASGEIRWQALAVGDSCIIHLRADGRRRSFPIERPEEFGRAPRLIATNPTANATISPVARGGRLDPGDVLLLATDALAHTMLSAPPDELPSLLERLDIDFEGTVNELRGAGHLRNDDVTMLQVTME